MERKFILIWFERFNTVNKGLLRLLSVWLAVNMFMTITYGVGSIYLLIINNKNFKDYYPVPIIGLSIYISSILLFRLLIWIYDGFLDKS